MRTLHKLKMTVITGWFHKCVQELTLNRSFHLISNQIATENKT